MIPTVLTSFLACLTGPVPPRPTACSCHCESGQEIVLVITPSRTTAIDGLPLLRVMGACGPYDKDEDGDVDLADWSKMEN